MAEFTREDRINAAIKAIREKQVSTIRESSRTFGIPNTTLQERLKGAQPHCIAHISSQRLTVPEEAAIEKTARQMEIWGWPLTVKALESLASNLLVKKGDFAPLGHDWHLKYLARHPALKAKKSRAMDQSRKDAGSYETLCHWFKLFNNTKAEYGVPDDDVYNMDEKGVMKGTGENQVVIINRDSKEATSAQPGNREWVTIIECIGGSGYVLAPFVIFEGKRIQHSWIPDGLNPEIAIRVSEKGCEKEAKKATVDFIKMVWREFPVSADVFSWDAKIKSFAKTTARQMTESSFPATPRPGKKIVVKMPNRNPQ